MSVGELAPESGSVPELWGSAPVYLVLADLRFSPVQLMSKYIDEIQELMRQGGYPEYKKGDVTRLFFGERDGQEPELERTDRWVFTNSADTSQFILTTSSLVFQTTEYCGHESFFDQTIFGAGIIKGSVKPASMHRVGLRYLDAIWPTAEHRVSDYLNAGLVGIELSQPFESSFSQSEYRFDLDGIASTLVLRVFQADSTLRLPPDLGPLDLELATRFQYEHGQRHCVLDVDHFSESISNFDSHLIRDSLSKLHGKISFAFLDSVTEFAQQQWKGGDK